MLLRLLAGQLPLPERLLFAIDDTPTKRAGPLVEGAGIHHNPTPGPADQTFLYGHIWVTIAWVVQHPRWGVIALPLRVLLTSCAKDLGKIVPWNRKHFPFRTKLELAAELVAWVCDWLRFVGKPMWVVADGAYAKRPFVKAVLQAGVVLVSRLRRDAALWSVPTSAGRCRGRPRKYGTQAISLAKRAAHAGAWQQATFVLYNKPVTKTFKTFLATYAVVGGLIRVVLVRQDDGWVAYFCTDAAASVEQILTAVADRGAIEQDFHEIKEVHGAGQQQVRHIFANVAVYHLNMWLFPSGQPHPQVRCPVDSTEQPARGERSDQGVRRLFCTAVGEGAAAAWRAACQRCGDSSSSNSTGWAGNRARTSRRYANVSIPRCLHVAVKLNSTAAVSPPASLPKNNQLLRPIPTSFSVRSLMLLSMCNSPSVV